jgi:hypothetical protein
MLRSADWNAHIHDVPPPPEDPPSEDPHPLFGEDITVEQLYQQQLAGWLQNNQGFAGHGQGQNQHQHAVHAPVQQIMHIAVDQDAVDLANNAVIVPPRLTVNTVVQGIPFHAGFHPDGNNTVDSPMQAYTEALSDSDSDIMVQFMLNDQVVFYHANASVLTRLSMAKATMKNLLLPRVNLDNSFFFDSHVKFAFSDLYELFGEAFCLMNNKRKSRKLSLKHNPYDKVHFTEGIHLEEVAPETNGVITELVLQPDLGKKRKNTLIPLPEPPSCTTQVHRSTRCNKYDGFKPNNFSDSKPLKSKVKPRKNPVLLTTVVDNAHDLPENEQAMVTAPDNTTPIPVLQSIGINLCGVPPEDLSPKKLLAKLQEDEAEDKS